MSARYILAIDTSTACASVAIATESGALRLLVAAGEAVERNRAGRDILPWADVALSSLGATPADLAAVAVARGPGSFTGVRIGVSTALGMALGLPLPVYGISTLAALQHLALQRVGTEYRPVALVAAGRGRVYVGHGGSGPGAVEKLVAPGRVAASLPVRSGLVLVGDAAEAVGPRAGLRGSIRLKDPGPLASSVAALAAASLGAGVPGAVDELRAVYLQPSGAMTPAMRARRRPPAARK